MKTYTLADNSVEKIEFRANENTFALVHRVKKPSGDTYKTIIMSKREVLALHQAIQEEVLK